MVDNQTLRAQKLLTGRLREIIGHCNVAGLGAALVTNGGNRVLPSAAGRRALGVSLEQNDIQSHDRWCLGSVSKPFTGTAIGVLIQKGIGNITWTTTLGQVFPELKFFAGAHPVYRNVTLELLISHASGMPYNPSKEPDDQWFPDDVSEGLTDKNLMARRLNFVFAAVQDEPKFQPGTSSIYGGGSIICAAMFEKRTGVRFEHLLRDHVYEPLGMAHSGWGVTGSPLVAGPWQHRWSGSKRSLVVNEFTSSLPYDFQSHGVAGALNCSAADMGRFIREHLRPDPQVMTTETRHSVQSVLPATGSNTTRGAWGCQDTVHPETADLWHNGDNGTMYADLVLRRSEGWGAAAMTNVNSVIGGAAVFDAQDVMRTMATRWNDLFVQNVDYVEAVHLAPALVQRGAARWLFARRHTGALVRQKLVDGGAQQPIEFPGGVFTSGIAASSSWDGKKIQVMGRGTDQRIWRAWSTDAGATWKSFEPILNGTFLSGPAVAMLADGAVIHVFGTGTDRRIWRAKSVDGGQSWSGWDPIGAGKFTSQPAAACSINGSLLYVFGRGTDFRVWWNVSTDDGATWQPHWKPIGEGSFSAGPAAACGSAGKVYVVGRGMDRALWFSASTDPDAGWSPQWQQIPDGVFASSPAIEVSGDGQQLDVATLGLDHSIYLGHSSNGGQSWDGWTKAGDDIYL
jgi:CubicO group peptidase (beta-lactamase class C family)